MQHVKIMNGDLHIIFKEYDEDVVMCYRLDNGSEMEVVDDELVGLILPNFESQLGRGSLSDKDIKLEDLKVEDENILFRLEIDNQTINGRIDCSSLNSKI